MFKNIINHLCLEILLYFIVVNSNQSNNPQDCPNGSTIQVFPSNDLLFIIIIQLYHIHPSRQSTFILILLFHPSQNYSSSILRHVTFILNSPIARGCLLKVFNFHKILHQPPLVGE